MSGRGLEATDESLAEIDAALARSAPHRKARMRELRKLRKSPDGIPLAYELELLALEKRVSAAKAWLILRDQLLTGTSVTMSAATPDGGRRHYAAAELRGHKQ
jgi:hypothetical protein